VQVSLIVIASYVYRSSAVEQSDQPTKKPSLFAYGLAGNLLAALIGLVIAWILAERANSINEQHVLPIVCGLGALGAYQGYRVGLKRRKLLKVEEPADDWPQFMSTWTFRFLAVTVLVGSFLISVAAAIVFDLIHGAPWLERK
jgi:hypothetical protein